MLKQNINQDLFSIKTEEYNTFGKNKNTVFSDKIAFKWKEKK